MKTTNALLVVLILSVLISAGLSRRDASAIEKQRAERAQQRATLNAEADQIFWKQKNYVSGRMQDALEGKLSFSTDEQEAMLLRAVVERMDARLAAQEKYP